MADQIRFRHTSLLILITITGLLLSCSNSSSDPQFGNIDFDLDDDWLIPADEVFDGGPGKDGIPSIDNPRFVSVSEANFIPDNRRVVGIRIDDDIRAYPHQILDWHEIVNDAVGENTLPVAVNFCPLTGTGMAWGRVVEGRETEFGVSGLLWRNNLLLYDRETDSIWSQMQLLSVQGELKGENARVFQVIETRWDVWKEMYPDSDVLSTDTGFSRDYGSFTYGSDFDTNHNRILFPIQNEDDRLQRKVRVHGIINNAPAGNETTVKAYPIKEFGIEFRVIEDRIGDTDYVIVGNTEKDISNAFLSVLPNGTALEFTAVQNELPVVMEDQFGNRYDIFGHAVEGPDEGRKLPEALSYTGYWYAWADMFPGLDIYTE
jgi:hypothetical protein